MGLFSFLEIMTSKPITEDEKIAVINKAKEDMRNASSEDELESIFSANIEYLSLHTRGGLAYSDPVYKELKRFYTAREANLKQKIEDELV